MRINREKLLSVLESVNAGLATREFTEQSSCLVFHNGNVITFNDEIACFRESPLKIEGAVKAATLLALLNKMPEDAIEINVEETSLVIKGKRRKANLVMEPVALDTQSIVFPEDDEWRKLDSEFSDALSVACPCISSDESEFKWTCVCIYPNHIQASDRFQIARYFVKTEISEDVIYVRGESIKKIIGYDMTEMGETKSWIHFRNPAGLAMCIRKHVVDDYPSLESFLSKDNVTPMTLPGGLEEIVGTAEIFSSENSQGNKVTIDLKSDKLMIEGHGVYGNYKEMKVIEYAGDPVTFRISPKLLIEISKKSNSCGVGNGKLHVDTGKFVYASSTQAPKEKT